MLKVVGGEVTPGDVRVLPQCRVRLTCVLGALRVGPGGIWEALEETAL